MNTSTQDSWNAEHYSQRSQLQYDNAFELFNKDCLLGNESVLDIGCGDGKITVVIASWLPQGNITGIDSSASMINYAVQTYQNHHKNLKFICNDATQMNLKRKFDVIVSFNCIHWVVEQKQLFQKIKAHLKKGGKFYAVIYPRAEPLWTAIEKATVSSYWRSYFTNYPSPYNFQTLTGYKKLLDKVSLSKHTIKVEHKVTKMKDIEALQNYIAGWLPYLSRLPVNLHTRFLNDIGKLYLQLNNSSPDLPYEQFNILAEN